MDKIPIRHIKEPDFSEGFSIRNIEAMLSGREMVQELHRHDFFFALFLEKGKGEHKIDFQAYPVTDHSVFFMRPGQVHQLTLKKESTGYLLQFNQDFYLSKDNIAVYGLRKVSNKSYCSLNSEKIRKIFSILAYIFEEYTEKQERYNEVIKANLELLFIELFRQSKSSESVSNNSNQYSQERLEELIELLQTHIFIHKQVAQYAEMLHLTSFQLNKITKETLGKTCSQIIHEQIILEAKRYLLATTNQVHQIAYRLGYEDTSYFIRFFKKHTGFSPETFRTNFK
ncbi:helix-turn-helix transcriptional regulator [soil metagenome]